MKTFLLQFAKRLPHYVVISIVISFFLCPRCFQDVGMLLNNIFFTILISIALWEGNGAISDYLNVKISWEDRPGTRAILGFVSMVVYTMIASFIVGFFLITRFYDVDPETFRTEVFPNFWKQTLIITIIISLFLHSLDFFKYWRKAALLAERLKRQQLASQYASLKSKLNPHFLFNSLNTLTALVHKDANQAELFIKKLSEIYRYVLENAEKEVVKLSEEKQFIESYIHLMKIRHGKNLHVHVDVPEDENWMIVPLTLQLLVENALKHNVISNTHPLHLEIMLEGEQVLVRNTLKKKSQLHTSTGLGLTNIKERYQHLSDSTLNITESTSHFEVYIPRLSYENIDH